MRRITDLKASFFIGLALGMFITVFVSNEVRAQTLDGNFLHRQCEARSGIESAYVTGVIDALVISGAAQFVLPTNGIVQQNRDVVCNGLAAFPEYRSLDASVLVHAYLTKAFPAR